MPVWFTADTHFGHANIIKHCRRPFASAEEMDAALIASINERVGVDDTLYHLGDFAFRGNDPASYRARIRCRDIVLIRGNHDPQSKSGSVKPAFAALFSSVHELLRIEVDVGGVPKAVVLCHYAMRVWDRSHHGAWHLYGHSHGTLPDDPGALSWDVGVDANGYRPLGVEEITAIMARKTFRAVDHHGSAREGSA